MKSTAREPILQINTCRGEPITTRYGQIVPLARVVKVRLPGGALIWNRPSAIEVWQGQSQRRVAIKDVTSHIIFTIVLSGVAIALGMSSFLKRRRNHKHD